MIVALADAMARLGSFSPGNRSSCWRPSTCQILARDGWTKPASARRSTRARVARCADLKRGGKLAGAVDPEDETRWEHRGRGPEDIHLVVAGGGAGGHSPSFRPGAAIATRWRSQRRSDDAEDPRSDRRRRRRLDVAVAKRVGGLDGKVLGLLHNGKVNGDRLLDLVREQLAARYQLRDIVVVSKPSASRVADPAVLDRLARECDAVVTAIGD